MRRQLIVKSIFLVNLFIISGCVTTAKLEKQYPNKPNHKAFALASGGQSGMSWGKITVDDAIDAALQFCRKGGGVNCRIVKINAQNATLMPEDYFSNSNLENFGRARLYRCNEISKSQAYLLLLQGHFYLDRDSDGHPCEWGRTTYQRLLTPSYKPSTSSNCHWVRGYRRKDGTYVSGHRRCR